MAELKIGSGPLKLTLTDDKGRVVAALRYPRVKWKHLVIESGDDEFDARVLSDTKVRLDRRTPVTEEADEATSGGEGSGSGKPEWDPFHEVEFGLRDFLSKAGQAVEDFLEDLKRWSGPISHDPPDSDDE